MIVEIRHGKTLVGRLAEIGGRVTFEYDRDYLAHERWDLSPITLPLTSNRQLCLNRATLGLPGMCHDSLPDAWGQKIMARWFSIEQRRNIATVRPLEQLCFVGTRGPGALTYTPAFQDSDESSRGVDLLNALDLRKAEADAMRLMKGDMQSLRHLECFQAFAKNGTAGGARPKLWVGIDRSDTVVASSTNLPAGFEPYMLKLTVGDDTEDLEAPRIEHAYNLMAGAAGLRTTPTRLVLERDPARGDRVHFAARRFDREGEGRIHFHSLAGMLGVDHKDAALSYEEYLATVATVAGDYQETLEAFRRAAFNCRAQVRDDHAKNHGFLYRTETRSWKVAPAYDLIHGSMAAAPTHCLSYHGNVSTPGLQDLRELAAAASLKPDEAESCLEQIDHAVAAWPIFAQQAGVSAERTDQIEETLRVDSWGLNGSDAQSRGGRQMPRK